MKSTINATLHTGTKLSFDTSKKENLAQLLFLNGAFKNVPLCSGIGKCGLCKVKYISPPPPPKKEEFKKISKNEINEGFRLACLHSANKSCEILVPKPLKTIPPHKATQIKLSPQLSLAIDLGTTGLEWCFTNGIDKILCGKELNPQIGLGSEIMSRLAYGSNPDGLKRLSDLVTKSILTIQDNNIVPTKTVISGNPSMISILKQEDITTLCGAPYALPSKGDEVISLAGDKIKAYVPPHLAPFVGADITAGLVALKYNLTPPTPPYLFADLGTNGEFVLALPDDKYLVASVPMGPSLEGVGMSCGTTAGAGAASKFTITPQGIKPDFISGEKVTSGITGTGYISLCARLLGCNVLNSDGKFIEGNNPLTKKITQKITTINGEPAIVIDEKQNLTLYGSDIEELLKVKAAFNLALSELTAKAGISVKELNSIILGGTLGQHISISDLVSTGFIPEQVKDITSAAGNTSLTGSIILTENNNAREFVTSLPKKSALLELAGSEDFGDKYLARMKFKYVY